MPLSNQQISFLRALPASDYQRLISHMKLVRLSNRQVIYESKEPITQVYFPQNGVISLVTEMEDCSTMEVGIVSNESMVGIPIILGGNTTITKVFVQVSGTAMQMDAGVLRTEFNQGGAIQHY
ncbi:cyclic nucleotide-binding domain-containing protein [Nostoc sp.]|uniref:cyclic nucleotide-binding domain-containing protein n=1 Tax=Nostoc sp. TaxID=1180 RepID=UPI002FF704BA